MIDCNKDINNNNENYEFISQSVNLNDNNSFYLNLGEFSPTINTGDELNEISLSEEKTRTFTNIDENQNQSLLRDNNLFLIYPFENSNMNIFSVWSD